MNLFLQKINLYRKPINFIFTINKLISAIATNNISALNQNIFAGNNLSVANNKHLFECNILKWSVNKYIFANDKLIFPASIIILAENKLI